MAKKLGTIKSISGSAEVIAVDKSGNQRVLKVGDSLYEGETVKTTSADSKVVIATNNGKELSMIGEDTLSLDPKATAADSQVAALQKALLNGANLEDLEETAAGGNSGGRGDGMSLGETRFEHGGHYSNISASTSAINPLGATSFAGPVEGKSGGLDSGRGGNDDDTAGAGTTIDPETTRKPSNPEIKFPEDTNKDGKISDDENKAGDKDAGKTTVEVTIPKDGSVKPGDKVVVTDDNGKKTEKPINQDDIDKGKIDIPVDLNPGKDNNVTAEIINPNNPNNPGKDSKVIGEDSENTKAPEAPVINEIIDDAKGYEEDTKVGNVLDVKGHLTNDKTPTIKGTAKAGSKVEIYDNGDRIGETTAKADGSWEFTAPELTKQGEHKFTATAENKFGKSTPSNEATIDLDSIAPKLDNVKITPIDTNSKADDTAELTMGTGHTDTPNAEILFRDENNNIIGKGHANSAGDFLIQLDKAVQPGTPVFVQAIDKAGNAGTDMAIAGNIEHPNDHTAPKVDIDTVTPVDETNPSDGTPDKGIVKGKSDEPNAPVVVTDENGKTIGTGTTDDKGNFEITTDPIKPGDKVKVEVTDKAGNKGSDTETAGDTEILHKDLPEAPVINEIIDDVKGYGEDTKVGNVLDVKGHLTNDKTPTIKGTAKAGSKVEIYDNGDRIGETTAKADGSWEFTAPELTKQGEHKFTATAENKFGKSTPSNEATIDLDSIAPKLDNVKITPIDTNSKADDTAELTMGTGHTDTPNAEILFRDENNNIIGKGHANSAGDFLIQLDKAVQPGTPVFVQAIDKAGNAGTDMAIAGNIEHPNDHTAPKVDIDTVTPVDETNPSDGTPDKGIVKGKSDEPNAPVVVTDENGKTIGTGTTDDKGNFEITTDPIKPGDKVKVEVTDKAGNKGSDTETAGDTEFVDNTPPSVEVKEVTPVDTNNPADGNPDKGIVKGHSDEPNAPVVVTDKDGKTIGTGTTDDKGDFEITTDPIKPGDKVNVEVTDKAGNKGNGEGTAGNTDFADKTAPDAPVITEVIDDVKGGKFNEDVKGGTTNDSTPTFKGTAEAGSTITLKNGNDIIAENIPVKADGSWEFTPKSPLVEGEYNITATATDKAGNVSNASNVATVTIDLHTSKPVINEIIDNVEGDTGNVKNERIGWTNDNTPTLKGSAEAGATVDVYVDGRKAGSVKANEKGEWEYTTSKLSDGKHSFYAIATDEAGNVSENSGISWIKVDTNPGEVVITRITDDNGDDALNGAYEGAMKDNTPTIWGTGEQYATVTVSVKDSSGKVVWSDEVYIEDSLGDWHIDVPVALNDGDYTVEASMQDYVKNPVQNSNVVNLTIDNATDKPVIKEIIDDVEGDTGDISSKNNWTNDNTPTLKGSAEAGADIKVFVDGKIAGTTKAGFDGSWEFTPRTKLSDGDHTFYVEATDKIGNTNTSDIETIKVDTNPGKVVITSVTDDNGDDALNGAYEGATKDNTPTINGFAEPYSTVTVSVKDSSGKVVWSGEVYVEDSLGDWSITVDKPLNDGDYTVEASMQDYVKNPVQNSNVVSLTVDTATDIPEIKEIVDNVAGGVENGDVKGKVTNDNTPTLKGSAEAGADIKVFVDGKIAGTTKAGFDGSWEFTPRTKLSDGEHKFVVEATDKLGHSAKSVEASVDVDTTIGNPKVRFVEDTNNDGVLSVAEVAAIKDGKAHWVIDIPTDGSVKAGDVIQSIDGKGNWVKFVEITDEMIKDGRFEATFNVGINKLKDGKYETPEYRFADEAGNVSDSSKATLTLDSEFSRKPSNPEIKFPEDTNKDGKISDDENKAGDKDAGKTTVEVTIPKDGSVKPGDKVVVTDDNGKKTEKPINQDDIDKGKIDIPVDLNPGKDNNVTAEIINPNNPNNPGKDSKVIGEASSTVKVTIDEIIDDVTGGVVNGDVKNGLTNDNLPTFKGSAAPGATVEIYESFLTTTEKTLVGKTVADANGKWSFTPTEAMGDGLHYFEAHATDSAGNKSITPKVELDVDATAPSVENLKVSPLDISNPADNTPEKGRVEGSSDTQDAKVIVKDEAGNVIGEGKVGGDGKFVIDTTKALNPGDKVKVEITDEAGNTGKGSAVTGNDIIHTHATTQVTIDEIYDDVAGGVVNGDVKNGLTNDNLPTFKGSAAPGATVEIYESFLTTTEKTLVGKTVADANGKWSFTPTEAMGDGEHYFEAVATDKVGNKSTSDRVSLDVDTFADAPVIDAVNDNVDSQTGNVLDAKTKVALTNDSTPTLEGYAEPNSVITIYEISELNGEKTAIGTVTADNHGGWKFELPELGDGEYKYTTRAQDKAGNISDFSEVVVVNADLIAPSEPTITFVEDINPKDGKLNKAENGKDGDSASTKAQISVPGDAEENDVIHYTVNGEEKTHTITYNDRVAGYVEVKVPVVDGKASSVTAKIVDQAGNASKEVSSSIDSDFTAPNVKITGIIDNVEGGVYKGNVAGTNTNDNKPTIKGTADANQEVVLYDNNKEFGRATADKDGNWEFKPSDYKEPLADLVGRVHVIKAVVTDAAGNTSEATSALEVDTTIGAPKVSIKEDADHNGVLSVEEAKNLKDSKIHWEVEIPKDGTVSAGDVLQVLGKDGKWKIEKVLLNDDLGKSFEYEATLSGKHFESPSYRIVDLVGNQSTAIHANIQLDSEFSRKPSNPEIKFPEDTNKDGKISDDENKAGDKDAGKTTVEVTIPKDGSVKPGDKVVVTDDNGKKTEKPINQDDIDKGKIDIPVDLNPGKDNNVTAEIINPNNPNNPGKDSKVIGEDSENTKAPEAPVINEVIDDQRGGKFNEDVKGGLTNDSTPTFKGTAKPGTTITLLKNGNDVIADNIPVKTDGSWEFTIKTPLAQGDYSITATAKNAAGKVSAPSDAATIKIDLHSDEPVITEIIDNVAGGVVNGDVKGGLTNDNTPTLKGTAEPFATVEIKIDGRGSYRFENGEVISNWTAVADKDGNWEFTTPKLSDGHHNFEAQATDVAGNNSQPSALVSIDVDTHMDAPVITAVTDNWWGGVENGGNILGVNDGFTNDTTPTFKGTAEAGSTIVLKNGNDIINKDIIVKADADGNWEFTPKSPLAEGEYNVVAIATDKAGNVSNPSNVATVNVDTSTTQPVITEIIDDVAGGVVGNVKNALTNDNLPTLKGTAEAFSTVKIKVDDRPVFKDGKEVTVTADKDGNWEYTFEANLNWDGKVHAALEDGVHTLKVQTTDRAGNRSAVSEWSSVDVDTTIGAPTVKITTDINSDKKIDIADASALKDGKLKWVIDIPENTVKAGDRVQILGNDAKTWTDIFKVTAQDIAKGFIERDEFSIDMPKSRGFQTPSYRLVDDAGNVSEGSMDAVKIVGFAPKAPTIIAVLDNEYGIDPKNPTDINAGDTTGNVLEGTIAITNDNTPTLMGKAEAGTTITLKNGDTVIAEKIPVDANGNWHYEPEENSPWADGDYKITAIAKNVFGKESESLSPITVTVDTTGPEVTLTSIEDNVKTNDVVDFTGNVKDKFTNDNTPLLKGTAEAGSVIIIKYGEHHENVVTTKADKNGHWDYKITNPLSDGEHIISYQAVDKAGNTSLEYVANVTVDTKIVDLRIDYLGDKNHDGKYSWSDNISNENNVIYCCARFSKEAVDQGLIKVGDKLYYEVHSNVGAWNKGVVKEPITITELDLKRGYVDLTSVANITYPSKELIPFGKTANGFNLSAKAYLVDEAGNMGKQASEDLVFDFSDKPADPVKNIKINAEAIYGDNDTGLWLEGHGPVLKASTELQPQLNGNDNYEIDVKTITHKAEFTLGSGDDIVNIHKSGNGWGWINMDSKIDLGDGNNRLIVAADLDHSTVISGKGDDYIEIKDDVANGAKIITGAGNDTVIVGDTVANTIFTKVGISTGDGNDSVTIKGDAIDKAKIDLGNGDDTLTIKAAHVISGVDDKGALDGGKGYDKLIISSPEDTIDLKHVSYHAKNFEELDISGDKNTTLKVGIKDVLDMTDDKHTLKITGDKGDTVDLKEDVKGSGWHQGASEDGYTTYTNNTVTIQIKDEIHVI